jgi:hypothetical protein
VNFYVPHEEQSRVDENIKPIRSYLQREFSGYEITTDITYPRMYHLITLSNSEKVETYKLKIGWTRLSNRSNTPETITVALLREGVADKLRDCAEFFWW